MAGKLLAARSAGQAGIHWQRNFVKCTNRLTTHINQAYNRQRAVCENPALISQWFKLIEKTKAKYGIFDKNIYNFDENGFMMGKITTQLVMTGSERRGWPKAIQLGNRKWVTVIPGIDAVS
jgi:RecB family endonuclease NucS